MGWQAKSEETARVKIDFTVMVKNIVLRIILLGAGNVYENPIE